MSHDVVRTAPAHLAFRNDPHECMPRLAQVTAVVGKLVEEQVLIHERIDRRRLVSAGKLSGIELGSARGVMTEKRPFGVGVSYGIPAAQIRAVVRLTLPLVHAAIDEIDAAGIDGVDEGADARGVHSPRIRAFVDTVDPGRVDFVNCGVHERQRQAYHGTYLGRWYPVAYTDAERALFRHYTARAAEFYAAQFARRYEPPTINPFMDEHLFLDELPDYRGDLCEAGHTFVRIVPEGQVRRCGPDDIMGHLVEGWFARRSQPSPCTDLECPYFCEKYRLVPNGEAVAAVASIPAAPPAAVAPAAPPP